MGLSGEARTAQMMAGMCGATAATTLGRVNIRATPMISSSDTQSSGSGKQVQFEPHLKFYPAL